MVGGTYQNVERESPTAVTTKALLGALLGLGKCPLSCLSYDEVVWWVYHKPLIQKWRDASRAQCSLLAQVEASDQWDLLQILTLVGTDGLVLPERRGAVTPDGHLLVNHRLTRLPDELRAQLSHVHHFTLSTFLFLKLRALCTQLVRRPRDAARETPDSLCQDEPSKPPEELTAVLTKGAATLLPLESTRDTGSTAKEEEAFTPLCRADQPPLASSPALGTGSPRWNNAPPSDPDSQVQKIVLFQHGLLESSLTWILPLWNSRDRVRSLRERLLAAALWPLLIFLYLLRWLGKQRRLCRYRTRQLDGPGSNELSASLPIRVMLERPCADVWLMNTRGNEFTCNLNDRSRSTPPLGYRPLTFRDFKRVFATYHHEDWTYMDSAVLDCETNYSMLHNYYEHARLKISAVCFSQGCAVYSLNTAIKNYLLQNGTKVIQEGNGVYVRVLDEVDSPEVGPSVASPPRITCYDAFVQDGDVLQDDQEEEEEEEDSPPRPGPPDLDESNLLLESSSGIFSSPSSSFNSSVTPLERHQAGLCGGLRECDLCSITPSMIVMICPPIVLRNHMLQDPLTGTSYSMMRSLLNFENHFCRCAWVGLPYLAIAIDIYQSFMFLRLGGLVGHAFVKHVLKFSLLPIHSPVADLVYRLTPSGITTKTNMVLWKNQQQNNHSLGHNLQFNQASDAFIKKHWSQTPLPKSLSITEYLRVKSSMYCPMQDNIADSIRGAHATFKNVDDASLRLIDLSNNSCETSKVSRMMVNLITAGSHLDVIWPDPRLSNVQQHIINDVLSALDRVE